MNEVKFERLSKFAAQSAQLSQHSNFAACRSPNCKQNLFFALNSIVVAQQQKLEPNSASNFVAIEKSAKAKVCVAFVSFVIWRKTVKVNGEKEHTKRFRLFCRQDKSNQKSQLRVSCSKASSSSKQRLVLNCKRRKRFYKVSPSDLWTFPRQAND